MVTIPDGYLHGKTERSVSDKGRDRVRYSGMKWDLPRLAHAEIGGT